MSLKQGRGCVYEIKYHVVWCVKYKYKMLEGEVADYLQELLREIAIKYDFKVESLEVVSDHVHALISASPQHRIPEMVKVLKGISARKIFLKFPSLKTKLRVSHLWNPSYFVVTHSENLENQIRGYVESQTTDSS